MAACAVLLEYRRYIFGKRRAGHIAHLCQQTSGGAELKQQDQESAIHMYGSRGSGHDSNNLKTGPVILSICRAEVEACFIRARFTARRGS